MEDRPRYAHDCAECVFLGPYVDWDLYFCDRHPLPTVIARRSGEPSDYMSGMEVARKDLLPELGEAYRRAQDRGLVPKPREYAHDQQYIQLFVDKVMGRSKFVAKPLPVLPQYKEAIQVWQELTADRLQKFVGQLFTPQTLAAIEHVAKDAINVADFRTGMRLEFEVFLISPNEWDERTFGEPSAKTAYEIIQEANARRAQQK